MFENKKIFILGMAKSGFEAAKLLATRNSKILITDQKEQKEEHVSELKRLGVEYIVTDHPEEILDRKSLVSVISIPQSFAHKRY